MNIYIKPDIEDKLRRYDGSMSGLVNRLLEDFFGRDTVGSVVPQKRMSYADIGSEMGVVIEPNDNWEESVLETTPPKKTEAPKPAGISGSQYDSYEKTYDYCKHGAVKGLCKKGCK